MLTKAVNRVGPQALVGVSPREVLLLTGYWPVMAESVAFFTQAGDVLCIVPEDEIDLAQATSDVELIPYRPASLDRIARLEEALLPAFRQALERLNLRSGNIGADLQAGSIAASYQSEHHLRSALGSMLEQISPRWKVIDCGDLFTGLEAVKSQAELTLLRKSAQSAGTGFATASDAIRAGRRENEVAAEIAGAFEASSFDGFERRAGYFYCMSGPNSFKAAGAYARTRTRVLEAGDLVMIHANTVGDGYWTDITRTYVVGKPTEQQRRMYSAVAEARRAALAEIYPGRPASAVDRAARDVLARRGFGSAFKHPTGHGVGFAAADGRALPRIHPKSPDTFMVGMSFNIEPAIYLEGVGGLRHCDVVSCGEHGAEVLTDFQGLEGWTDEA